MEDGGDMEMHREERETWRERDSLRNRKRKGKRPIERERERNGERA